MRVWDSGIEPFLIEQDSFLYSTYWRTLSEGLGGPAFNETSFQRLDRNLDGIINELDLYEVFRMQ